MFVATFTLTATGQRNYGITRMTKLEAQGDILQYMSEWPGSTITRNDRGEWILGSADGTESARAYLMKL